MKLKNLFAGMILCLAVASCIQDEAQNVEADAVETISNST